ncbi:hypothetical protein A3B21_00580 [Candidatus Uhrbacteria bacterium RIFCSPLOWO2_01_FULL_47_24]|uniref:Nudix hydrolase domain-containing protein n=1 Tax=Candidatus Uhrbacteria bacterium RIFCSPLOWO2_01_FULL_47_24 TaxID=1802401 RepID=A0A1F7UNK2_9BACT|nr:MAG: hypothetical protein A2753_04750 [Candidatus Uhrbacteria bacterium RIFCSPHIGHO2_01_FULL_47_11]OGL67668.1 MAG: hypothetical protein A3D58_04470 [Candidatus Uhrbacteria bacterium RIFCSPHIGHO2_02_FULL_46_47]OGL74851.1 MAG: hypothetical protein A3F52_00235 [Candidatus Uhrbacteria bacterium RIFCSPHIGHO2_12_FULL_47_11]OGL79873.1 MAG: hypothetical protein A3B21_00580 [Candidatus Uhrbacteria bacterium RIFCSPLOWO2_01_FULL_47_24]OGL84093.1 MAG: hypothetical protein A3J03_03375 [Candidatus Uhrbact
METVICKEPIVAVIALIKDAQGRVLVQKRGLDYIPAAFGIWEFPGGGIEFGETPEEAIKREVKEEIGCEVEIVRLLPYAHTNTWDRADDKKIQVIVLCYECRIVSGIPTPSHTEVTEIKWCTKEEAARLHLMPGNLKYIEMAI